MRKKYFYILFIIIIILIIGIALIEKPKSIKISAYTYPYSIVSKCEDVDTIDIKLFHINSDSYFLDKDKYTSAYIEGDEGKIKLSIDSIEVSSDSIEIKDDTYNYVHLLFNIDFKTDDEYELLIKKAYLKLEFSNNTDSTIYIGSFSYYKYKDNSDDLSITSLKVINKKEDSDDAFYGIIIGIKNNTNHDIVLNSIDLLDVNIDSIDVIKIIDDEKHNYDYYFNNDTFYLDSINLFKNEYSYLAIKINYKEYDLNVKISSLGLKLNYDNKAYYMEKFTFYKENTIKVDTNSLTIYEYAK